MKHLASWLRVPAFLALFIVMAPASAALVIVPFTGTVDTAGPNPFGILSGDTLIGSTTVEGLLLGPGQVEIPLGAGSASGSALNMTLGPLSFFEDDDIEFGFGFPSVFFTDGLLSGFDFVVEFTSGSDDYTFDAFGQSFSIILGLDESGGPLIIAGRFNDLAPFTAPVPEPSTYLLFGIGLLGLLGISIRRGAT